MKHSSEDILDQFRAARKPERQRNVWSKLTVALVFVALGIFTHALVAQQWWAWFLTPHGLGSITITQAIVLRFGAAILTMRSNSKQPDRTLAEFVEYGFVYSMLAPGFAYLLGWALVTWMPL